MSVIDIEVPDIGDFAEVGVTELLVNVGDTVAKEQSLITVESDKASIEIPSSHAGVIKEILIKIGDKVSEGSVIVKLEAEGAATALASAAAAPSAAAPSAAAPAPPPAAAAPAAACPLDIKVPDIGDFKDVAVIELLVKVGDTVAAEQSLFTVESDKASMEIPSLAAGTITALTLKIADKVNVGDVVGQMNAQGVVATPASAAPATPAAVAAPAAAAASVAAPAPNSTGTPVLGLPHA